MLGRSHSDTLDAGPHKRAPGTQRFCAVSGAVRPVDEMIRFVVGPDGTPVPDLKRRLPGRGIWIMATRQALRSAIARKAFAHAFEREVRLAPDLVETTERLMERAALEALAMCHKAGKVAIGFANADAALARARVAGLLHAAEAAPDGARNPARGRAPHPRGRRGNRGHRCIYLSAIGFGIGTVKCDTCSPARRSRKRDVPGARRAP